MKKKKKSAGKLIRAMMKMEIKQVVVVGKVGGGGSRGILHR